MREETRTVTFIDPYELKNHPLNIEIYGDAVDDDLVESVGQRGIRVELHVLPDLTVISGHRRMRAARMNKMNSVPCFVRHDLTDPFEAELELIDQNKQRPKTTEQRAREYQRLREIEAELAKKRQAHGQTAPGKRSSNKFDKRSARSSERAAERVGLSAPTAEKASIVVDAIDEAAEAGDTERANTLRGQLNNESVAAAHRTTTQADKARRSPAKSRTAKFDNKAIESLVGKLIREIDKQAAVVGTGPLHEACVDAMRTLYESLQTWAKASQRRPTATSNVVDRVGHASGERSVRSVAGGA